MRKLKTNIFVVAGIATMALAACTGTAKQVAQHQADRERAVARMHLLQAQLQESALQPRAVPVPRPETPPPKSGFQFCLIGTASCMALDPRPFVMCPAADDSVCAAQGEFVLLGGKEHSLELEQATPQPQTSTERR